jgi:hypothetical protein
MSLRNKEFRMLHGMMRKTATIGFSAISLLAFSFSAQATNLIVNGSFESTTNGPGQFNTSTTTLTGWSSSGYNFVFASGGADTTGANGEYGNVMLWGPNDGSNNGLPASSPDGGNFIAADGAFEIGAITQTVSGLTVGDTYTLSFYWAGAQQTAHDGATTEQWKVTLGGVEQDTPILDNANHGFTGWQLQTFDFTANSTSELLSFLAVGTPNGVPPFSLLDGVSLNADTSGAQSTPEPGSVVLILGGLMVGLGARRLQKRVRSK